MSAYGYSPPPQMIQLRDLIWDIRERKPRTLSRQDRADLKIALQLANRIIDQYPMLTKAASDDS